MLFPQLFRVLDKNTENMLTLSFQTFCQQTVISPAYLNCFVISFGLMIVLRASALSIYFLRDSTTLPSPGRH